MKGPLPQLTWSLHVPFDYDISSVTWGLFLETPENFSDRIYRNPLVLKSWSFKNFLIKENQENCEVWWLRTSALRRYYIGRRFWGTDGNRNWFRNQRWRHTSQTSGDRGQKWGFVVRVQSTKTRQDREISRLWEYSIYCSKYFWTFLEFTEQSTIQFQWS